MCRPNNAYALPSNMFLFSSIKKYHYDHVKHELELRNATYERIKLNSKGKEVKLE